MNKDDELPPLPIIIINNIECIVCYQELSSIFNDSNWGVKYYQQNQKTFVQLSGQNQEENPLDKLRLKKATKNSKYSYGELTVEWKQKKDIDDKKNIRNGGFVYIHFFVSRELFI
ncbi:hypothetical protein GLOIN_2v1809092 [Rhizophagus clarus]|uniref:Uncharacterized protein n=1 Tax=Rhizophagus clarus TaxID=94130 RepID=A0A8H3LAY2_9GLOM|nr:hypothetical protein GLOIN_2v1809092 [Rhizophagus clarus]